MAWWTPARIALTTLLTRSGETCSAVPPRYLPVLRKDAVALAPEPAALGLGWVVVMRSSCSPSVGDDGDVVVADQVGHRPAVEVVLGQAGLGQALHLFRRAHRLGGEEQLGGHALVVAGALRRARA